MSRKFQDPCRSHLEDDKSNDIVQEDKTLTMKEELTSMHAEVVKWDTLAWLSV